MKYNSELSRGAELRSGFEKYVKKNKSKGAKLDAVIHPIHSQVFQQIDCLECANCCKTTSPIFRDVDIKRLSKHLRLKESQFIEQYLTMDEDQDYVLQSSPCAFLNSENKCEVYEYRPQACREYPHTDRKNSIQIGALHVKNLDICPAVVKIVDSLLFGTFR